MIRLASNRKLKHRYQVYCFDKRTDKQTNNVIEIRIVSKSSWKISTQINLNQCHHQANKQTDKQVKPTRANLRTANVIKTRQRSCLCYQIFDRIETTFVALYIFSFEMIICCRDKQIRNGNRKITLAHTHCHAIVALVAWQQLKIENVQCTRQWCNFRLGYVKYKLTQIQSRANLK